MRWEVVGRLRGRGLQLESIGGKKLQRGSGGEGAAGMRTERPRAGTSQSYSPQEFLSTPPPCDLGCQTDHVDQRRICFHFYSSKTILVRAAEAS